MFNGTVINTNSQQSLGGGLFVTLASQSIELARVTVGHPVNTPVSNKVAGNTNQKWLTGTTENQPM